MTVDELHGVVKEELKGLRNEMAGGFEGLREEIKAALRTEIKAEGETTRRHFDVVAERIESHVKLVAEVNSHHATVLDNHETRLQKIEGRR